MGLKAVLVDRGRTISKATTGQRVEGTKKRTPVTSPWFRCRLELPSQTESRDAGRVRGVSVPTLYVYPRNEDQEPVNITGEMQIEVVSKQLGTRIYDVQGDPGPERARRKIKLWTVELQHVES